jgi:uncharacterized protein (DUF488 family)
VKPQRLLTIGAFGFNENSFYEALRDAGVDLFCDIRARRGVRGREYAFVNSRRLQTGLEARGIRYIHCRDLAPSEEMRELQFAADKAAKTPKRQRTALSPDYAAAYSAGRLDALDSGRFVHDVLGDSKSPVFFCVERDPSACHRSLMAEKLGRDLGVAVEHLRP